MPRANPAPPASGLRARLLRGVGWNLVATVSNQGSTLVLNVCLANLWGGRAFGEYAAIQATIAAMTAGALAVTSTTITKYVAEWKTHDPARVSHVLSLCFLVATGLAVTFGLVLFAGARPLAARLLDAPSLGAALATAAVAVCAGIGAGAFSAALAGFEAFPTLARVGVLNGLLYVGMGGLAGWRLGPVGAVAGIGAAAIVQCALLAYALRGECRRRGIPVPLSGGGRDTGLLLRFLVPATINSLLAYPAIWIGNVLLVRHADGFREVALFAAANSFRILVLFVPTVVNTVTLSLFNDQLGAADRSRSSRVFGAGLGLNAAAVTAGALFVALAGPWLVRAFGRDFSASYPALLVLMLATLPEAIGVASLQVVQSKERVWLSMGAIVAPCYLTLAGAAYLLAPVHGAVGLAWSYVAAMSVACIAAVIVVARLRALPVAPTAGSGGGDE